MNISIGELSRRAGVKVPTIRYYEQIGLVPEAERTEGHQRRYGKRHLELLNFIRHSRDLGFSVDQIRQLLNLAGHPDQPCSGADAIARAHLASVRAKIERLRALESELERITDGCDGGSIAECRVIEVLADHGMCLHEDH
jgi:DNA-binding transcriptional MerR regulator